MKTKYDQLRDRARKVLRIGEEATLDQIKYAANCRLFKHHPDRNPEDVNSTDITKLIIEAYHLLKGKTTGAISLENDYLVTMVINDPVIPLDEFSYENWLKDQFYGSDGLIWPDSGDLTIKNPEQKNNRKKIGHDRPYEQYAIEDRGFFDFVKPD